MHRNDNTSRPRTREGLRIQYVVEKHIQWVYYHWNRDFEVLIIGQQDLIVRYGGNNQNIKMYNEQHSIKLPYFIIQLYWAIIMSFHFHYVNVLNKKVPMLSEFR